jgi:hypothetical protein
MEDASGAGVGMAFWDDMHLKYQDGFHAEVQAHETSNFQETDNLVLRTEELSE